MRFEKGRSKTNRNIWKDKQMLQPNRNKNTRLSTPITWLLVLLLLLVIAGVIIGVYYLVPSLEAQQTPQTTPFPSPSPTSTPYLVATFEVLAAKGWQDTGVYVNSDDQVEIIYVKGLWTGKSGLKNYTGPAGGKPSQDNPCNPMSHQETGYNALIGKIWYGKPFLVGQHFTGKALISGTIYLRMNDCDQWLADNVGSVHVLIQISR